MTDAVLIVALSGRALAAAARRAGLRPFVLDIFGDQDTAELAEANVRVKGNVFEGLAGDDLQDAAGNLDALAGAPLPLIYGAGLEGRINALAGLTEDRALLGNRPDSVDRVKDPRQFFPALAALGIEHPAVRFELPSDPAEWLAKRIGGAGGMHIRPAGETLAPTKHYYQRRVAGRALGVSFLAADGVAEVLSVNALWSADPGSRDCFVFGGMAGPVVLAAALEERTADLVARLTRCFDLVGLNSVDLMLDGGDLHVLEVNPRPGAAVDLYRQEGTEAVLALHVVASRGALPASLPPPPAAGLQVVYAPQPVVIPDNLDWPDWAVDRPLPRSRIGAGEPLCSVLASGDDFDDCRRWLRQRAEACLALSACPQPASLVSAR